MSGTNPRTPGIPIYQARMGCGHGYFLHSLDDSGVAGMRTTVTMNPGCVLEHRFPQPLLVGLFIFPLAHLSQRWEVRQVPSLLRPLLLL